MPGGEFHYERAPILALLAGVAEKKRALPAPAQPEVEARHRPRLVTPNSRPTSGLHRIKGRQQPLEHHGVSEANE